MRNSLVSALEILVSGSRPRKPGTRKIKADTGVPADPVKILSQAADAAVDKSA